MCDSTQNTVVQNEVFPETSVNDVALQTTNTNFDFNVTPEISNVDANSLCNVEADKTLTSEYDLNSNNDTTVDTTVQQSCLEKSSNNEQNEDYNMGDIVWAKIGKYPFWPSVVCVDPNSRVYFKKTKVKFFLHVRFCNDKGRRSWVKVIRKYCGKFELLSKYPDCLSYIKNNKKLMDTWNVAVEEADCLLKFEREERMRTFCKTFCNSDDLNGLAPYAIDNSSESTATANKIRTYSRKRSLTVPEQDNDSKIKTENISINGSTSSRSIIDIPQLLKSDDADSTVSDISLSYVYMGDMNAKMKRGITKKKRSTKTYPPKSSITDKFDLSDSMENSLEYNDDNSMLSDNPDQFTATTTSTTRKISKQRKLEICALEFNQEHKISLHSIRPKKTLSLKSNKSDKETCSNNEDQTNSTLISQSSSDVKKIVSKRIQNSKELTGGRKSTAVKSESSPEPDTTESETSSKNENFSSFFLVTKKNKQLFIKTLKKACVVCKNIENTIKCVGPCQSYFHEECLNKSEQRYHKNEPKIEIQKTQSRRKRRSLKCYSKKKDSVSKNLKNINEENTDNLEDKLLNQPISDDSKNINGICSDNENAPGLSEIEKVDKDSIQEIVTICITEEEKNVDDSIIRSQNKSVTNEKSLKSDSKYMCSLCKANKTICFLCGLDINDPEQKIVCKISNCGKYYHDKCLADWPQCQWNQNSKNNIRSVVCPHHVCHLCISDNPKSSCRTYFAPEKLIRCIKCPTAYHRSEYCLPAGSQVLSNSDIVCSRHYEPKEKTYHFNATWCFICTLGGALICCDLCPSSFHIECLNQNPSEFIGGYTCEECQTGRYPLYGEIVWVKIGNYRWWPAQIVFPNQVPDTVNVIAHSIGQFAVRFFGSYDYYWVNRGRVFNFHEGDDENMLTKNSMKGLDQVFQDAIIEAAQAHNAYILDKDKNDAKLSNQSSTKPPKYVRIKFNKPYGNVKNMELDNTAMTPCECDATKPDPCGPGSDCINRMLMFECHPQICPAGDKCNNQRFEKTLYPAMVPFLTKGRGWGLKTLEDIQEGTFVIEYVGDVIDEEEFQRRCVEMHQRNEQNYYFLTIDNSRMIDAGPKGNLSRFMNHSCEPNCVTQKWTVNGVTRIGLFALHDIPAGTELVFDYRLQSCSEVVKKPCQCGAARCSKFIGVKVEEEKKKVISVNDPDKSKATTKSKRKLLKLKDNASDSDKSKSSKVTNSDQSTSTTENVIDSSNTEKFDDSKKLKNKVSMGKPAIILKNENSESTETQSVLTKKCKTSMRNSIKMTKDDDVNSFESEEIDKSKQKIILPIPSSRKQLIKDNTKNSDSIVVQKKQRFKNYKKKNVTKTNILPLSKNYNELSVPTLLSDKIGHIVGLKNMKTASNRTKDLIQTEKINEASVVKKNESTVTQERSRHSLTRLAKSRHSFLSKEATKPIKPIKPKRKLYKEQKEITKVTKSKTKIEEMQSVKTVLIKKKELNKHNLLSKTYYKNDSCLICGKGHAELSCKNKKCPRVFHLSCMNKSKIVKSGFICPSHFCSMCKKRKVVARCKFCVKSFCMGHVKGNIFKDPLGNGMLCITHHPDKKSISKVVCASSVTPNLNVTSTRDVINKNDKSIDVAFTNTVIKDDLSDNVEEQFNIHTDEINEEEYISTQVIKDECDREYIHIGGFNVCNMSDLVTDQEECYIAPVDTDGDLFKPSSANVVIDIESASALYQSTDNLQLVSIATDNKDSHDYANVHFIPDVNSTKNKWLTTEP